MSSYTATITWKRGEQAFSDNRYSREHRWLFDGGAEVVASSSPAVVPLPYSNASAVDPEEAFVASVASCHMLWFLSIAAKRRHLIDLYEDEAVGVMARNADGKLAITVVTLRPRVSFGGALVPTPAQVQELHDAAHHECFIANSVRSEIRIEPR